MMTGATQGDKEGGPPARRPTDQAASDRTMTDPTTSETAPGTPAISLVVPAFDEELRLPPTLERLAGELDDVFGPDWQLVVSDDGSSDRTAEVALDAARSEPRIVVVTNPVNQGKGAALVDGFAAATAPVVVFLDADLPVEPAELAPLVAAVADADVVVGSRRLPGSSFPSPQPWARRFGGGVFLQLVGLMGLRTSSDPQCGTKVLRRATTAPVVAATTSQGFAFDIELLVRARNAGLRTVDVPVRWHHAEGSSIRPVRDGASTVGDLWRLRRRLRAPSAP